MEVDAIDKKLKKIITVFEAFKADNKISKMERDLLLGYLRDIYELVLDNENVTSQDGTPQVAIVHKPKPTNISETLFNSISPEVSQNIDVQSSITSSIIQKEELKPTLQPIIETKVLSSEKDSSNPSDHSSYPKITISESTPLVTIPVPESTSPIEVKITGKEQPSQASSPELVKFSTPSKTLENDKLHKLFVINKGSDISEKLAMSPISDIGKAMGLNERMFTITELFSGDNNLFNKTIEELNKFSSFEEAKSYLTEHLATQQKWDQDSKWEKAHTFVKLIRRRYQA